MKSHTKIRNIFSVVIAGLILLDSFAPLSAQLAPVETYLSAQTGEKETGAAPSLLPEGVLPGLSIPKDIASVKGFHPARRQDGRPAPVVVYILEAHANYQAQKGIAALLDLLVKQARLQLILVEGGVGDVRLARYRALGDKHKRKEVSEKLLKEGKISAEEYVDLSEDYPLALWGIENPTLYDENLIAFSKSNAKQEELLGLLAELEAFTDRLRASVYTAGHNAFLDEKRKLDKAGASVLVKKYQFLVQAAETSGVGMEAYPRLRKLAVLAGEESQSDYSNISFEKDEIIRILTRKTAYRKIKPFIDEWAKAEKDRDVQIGYFSRLADFAEQNGIEAAGAARLRAYSGYLKHMNSVISKELLTEADALERHLEESFLKTEAQKKLYAVFKNLAYMKTLLKLELVHEDYRAYPDFAAAFRDAAWKQFLAEEGKKAGIESPAGEIAKTLEASMGDFASFYKVASLRDQAMSENIFKKVTVEDQRVAAFISGGFHEERMIRKLNQMGMSVLVLAPRFTADSNHHRYFNLLKTKWKAKTW